MNLAYKIKNLFQKKSELTEDEIEEQYISSLAEENDRELMEEMDSLSVLPASVIMYIFDDSADTEQEIQMLTLIEEFGIPVEPEKDSIIWILSSDGRKPYKVIRTDYIHDIDDYHRYRQYIVVEPAIASDVMRL